MLFSRATFLAVVCLILAAALGRAAAQSDVAPGLLDRPPVAAPTSKVAVGAISVVLTESQEVDNFASGLLQGLMAAERIAGIGLVVVREDHVIVQRYVGSVAPETRFPAGRLSQIFDTIAAMQLIEKGRLKPDSDVAAALGEKAPRGLTLAQLLTQRSGDPALLPRMVEKASAAGKGAYVAREIAQPLSMTATGLRDGALETTLADMGLLAIALVNGGAFQTSRILMPATVDDMEATHFTLHPALPGWAYGSAEMRRNGWRALQAEGGGRDFSARLVIVPETKLAYLLVVEGRPTPTLWRTLDTALFDKVMPRRANAEAGTAGAAAPTPADARGFAGTYEPARDSFLSFVSFKSGNRLFVGASADGSLRFTGAENATLPPRPGGFWGGADGNLNAVARDGRLILSTGAYRALALYKRPLLYASLALLFALGVPGAMYFERRVPSACPFPRALVLGLTSASVLLVAASLLVWLFSPSA